MGFLNGLGRLLQGKPVFEDPGHVAGMAATTGADTPAGQGPKAIPEIRIDHCHSHIDGTTMTTTAWLTNTSSVEVELDKIHVTGVRREIDRRLAAGAAHEVTVYHGPVMMNDYDKHAELQYKTMPGGDYFLARFAIEYDRQPNGAYVLEDFHPQYPIRDI